MKHKFYFRLLLGFMMLVGHRRLEAQLLVWPGDITNNGIVNNIDFLQLGLAYNYFGPARDSVDVSFQGQAAAPWNFEFANGVNFAFADCNGDGLVNYYYDAFPLYVYYGFKHGLLTPDVFTQGVPGVDPPLFLDSTALPSFINGGQTLDLPLVLGTEQLPIENLYGIAFSIFVDPQYVDADQVTVNFNQMSWANPDNDRISTAKRVAPNRIDVGWVRTDHNDRSGHGPLGYASFIIIDDVVGLKDAFMIRLDSIKMLDRFGNETAVEGDTLWVEIAPEAASGTDAANNPIGLRVNPNPAHDYLNLKADKSIESVRLYDAVGRQILQVSPRASQYTLYLPPLPPGVYILETTTGNTTVINKVKLY